MHGIYNYIAKTNYVPREYIVAAILFLLFMEFISLVPVLNHCNFTLVFSEVCVQYPIFLYFLDFMFPGVLLAYFLSNFEIVPVAPIITGIKFVFTFHVRCVSILRPLYFRIFLATFLNTFLSPEIAASINIHVPFSLSRIIMCGLLLGIVLSVYSCWFHNIVTLSP